MAETLSSVLGDAIVATIDWALPRLQIAADAASSFVAEATRPDPPMTIRTLRDEVVSGILIVDRGEVLAFIGTCRPAQAGHRQHAHDEPLWPRSDIYSTR